MNGSSSEECLWRISLWGRITITSPDGVSFKPASKKVVEMLALLALRRNAVAHREEIASELWPEADPVSSRNRLKQTLAMARREVPGLPLQSRGKHELEFCFDLIRVDVRELAERVRWLSLLSGQARIDALVQLMEHTSESLLAGIEGPWADAERRTWSGRRATWADEVARHESRSIAFRMIDEFRPSDVLVLGRERELEIIDKWLRFGDSRSLCIVGPPGVGKTRLLAAWCSNSNASFDAVIGISTSQAYEANWIDRLCDSLGAASESALTKRATTLLRGFHSPVIAVDDIDQAPDDMRAWIEDLYAAVPRLRLICTARTIPNDGSGTVKLQGLPSGSVDSPATRLLRSFALRDGIDEFELDAHSSTLSAMAHRLEGLPLALEVVAGWLGVLSPETLRERLSRDSGLLVEDESRGGRSLKQSVSRVTQDLSICETNALLSFAVCRGGMGERLADALLGPDWPWYVKALAERSLIYRVCGKAGPRHVMLQALRESVIHTSEPEAVKRIRRMLWRSCLELMRVASREAFESEQAEWLNWLNDESENLLFALQALPSDMELLSRSMLGMTKLVPALRQTAARRRFEQAIVNMQSAAKLHRDKMSPPVQAFFRLGDLYVSVPERGVDAVTAEIEFGIEFGLIDSIGGWETIGSLQYAAGNYEASLKAFQTCADIASSAGLPLQAHWMDCFMIHAERKLGRTESSELRKSRSREFAEDRRIYNSVGEYDLESARASLESGRLEESLAFARSSVRAFGIANETRNRVRALLFMAEVQICVCQLIEADSTLRTIGELIFADDDELLGRRDELVTRIQQLATKPSLPPR